MKTQPYMKIIVLGCFFILTQSLHAQTPNDTTAKNKDSLQFSWKFATQGSFQSGPLDRATLLFSNNLVMENKKFELRNLTRYSFGSRGTKTLMNDWYIVNRFSLFQNKRIYPLAIGAYMSSLVYNLDDRWFGGVGGGWNILKPRKDQKLVLMQSFMYESASFVNSSGYESMMYNAGIFGNNVLFNRKLIINYHLLAFFSLQQNNIYRYIVDLSIAVPLTKWLSLSNRFNFIYENKTDSSITVKGSTVFSFGLQVAL